jgi:uncharacterized integral membrane protein (TIGR00697 family)
MTPHTDPFEQELVPNPRHYRYYDLVMAAFVTVLLCSNLIGPGKTCLLFGITFGAGNLFFPISYIFGDVLTEVYGYARTRKVIWAGFSAMIFATIMGLFVIHLPGDPEEMCFTAARSMIRNARLGRRPAPSSMNHRASR